MTEQVKVIALYKKLISLYPQRFREVLGESMEQTFRDLCNQQQGRPANRFFILSLFAETAIGIVREHSLLLVEGAVRRDMLVNPKSAALISFILCLPLAVPYLLLTSDINFLTEPINTLFTIEGQPGNINILGRIVILGGLVLLPVAFLLNLQPILRSTGPEGKGTFHSVNLILAAAILLLIAWTWGGLILEQIYCLQGIRCD